MTQETQTKKSVKEIVQDQINRGDFSQMPEGEFYELTKIRNQFQYTIYVTSLERARKDMEFLQILGDQEPIIQAKITEHLPEVFYIRSLEWDEDDRKTVQSFTLENRESLRRDLLHYAAAELHDFQNLPKMESFADFSQIIEDMDRGGNVQGILRVEDYEKYRSEKERRELEGMASKIAYDHNLNPLSDEFLDLLYLKIEGVKAEKYAMKEDGLCAGFGITVDQYFADQNYLSDRANDYERIIGWIARECPLMMMKYHERRKARIQEENAA